MNAALVISGSGRGAGKTAVGCALIRALPEWKWTAVKITPHAHGENVIVEDIGKQGADSRLAGIEDQRGAEVSPNGYAKGTARYLAAGARRAFLLNVRQDWAGEPLPEIEKIANGCLNRENILVESNRFSQWGNIFVAVTGVIEAEWKQSFPRCVEEANALVLTNGIKAGDLPERLRSRSIFWAGNGDWAPAELVEFVRKRLSKTDGFMRSGGDRR